LYSSSLASSSTSTRGRSVEVEVEARFLRFEEAVNPQTRRPASTTFETISLFFCARSSGSVGGGAGVLRERFEATRFWSGSVGSRRRLAMLGLRLFGLVRRGTGPLLASDFRRGREGSREGLFWAAAVDVETPECRFRRSEAAEKVESRAVLRLWRRVGSSQGRGMKRP
jgi:hypothetical protein